MSELLDELNSYINDHVQLCHLALFRRVIAELINAQSALESEQDQRIEQLEKERDDLRARISSLLETNQMLTEHLAKIDYEFTEAEMAEHDAEVIKRAIQWTGGYLKPDPRMKADYHEGWNDLMAHLESAANQLRQKSQEPE